jgi:hypothetical protein
MLLKLIWRVKMSRIMDVQSVQAVIVKTNPPGLVVSASGEVATAGWTNIRLEPFFYIMPPADGIWDLDFSGDPPTGFVAQVVLPVSASITLPVPKWLKGVRVHAAQNQIEAKIGKEVPYFTVAGGHVVGNG